MINRKCFKISQIKIGFLAQIQEINNNKNNHAWS